MVELYLTLGPSPPRGKAARQMLVWSAATVDALAASKARRPRRNASPRSQPAARTTVLFLCNTVQGSQQKRPAPPPEKLHGDWALPHVTGDGEGSCPAGCSGLTTK